jgi:methylated-DNA-[protein]-cysteine S-methyltransferase
MSPRHIRIETELGELTLVADGEFLTGLYFAGHWYPPTSEAIGSFVAAGADELLRQTATELDEYLRGARREFTVPVRTVGDAFQEDVWRRLKDIPYGERTTYGALAQAMGHPALAQRVGQAVGHNPVSILIPCHRVVGADGALTGYAGGLRRKALLLEIEVPAEVSAGRLF